MIAGLMEVIKGGRCLIEAYGLWIGRAAMGGGT